MAMRRHLASASACIFVLRPPRERPTACFCSPLFRPLPNDALPHAWNRSSVCLRIVRSRQGAGTGSSKSRVRPNAQSDYKSWSKDHIRAAIAPPAASLEHMHFNRGDQEGIGCVAGAYSRTQVRKCERAPRAIHRRESHDQQHRR